MSRRLRRRAERAERNQSRGRPANPSAVVAQPAAVLRAIEWKIVRRLEGRVQGNVRTAFTGAGIDVTGLREYTPEDEARHIDWNVTARLDVPHIRQYQEDRDTTVWLLLDRSASMTFGPIDRGKDAVLTEIATALASAFSRSGNRVGAILYDNGVERVIPPGGTQRHVLQLVRQLLTSPQDRSSSVTALAPLLERARLMIRRRSLVVLISDLVTEPGWERPLALLGQRHDVVVLQLTDPRDVALPDVGLVAVEDVETGAQMEIDTSDAGFRASYAAAAAAHCAHVQAATRRHGIDLFEISTTDDLVEALVRIARRRAQRRVMAVR